MQFLKDHHAVAFFSDTMRVVISGAVQPHDLEELMDGDIEDLEMYGYGALLAALLGSEIEVFRVYDYSVFDTMSDTLWKYQCFDEYTGTEWSSTESETGYIFTAYTDYFNISFVFSVILSNI